MKVFSVNKPDYRDLNSIKTLFNKYSFFAQRQYKELLNSNFLASKRLDSALKESEQFFICKENESIVGVSCIKKLDFQNNIFNKIIYKIDYVIVQELIDPLKRDKAIKLLLESILEYGKMNGIDSFQVRIDVSEVSVINMLERFGFGIKDVIAEYYNYIRDSHSDAEPLKNFLSPDQKFVTVIPFNTEGDMADLQKISKSIFKDTRFHRDANLGKFADVFYEKWIINSANGRADRFLVAKDSQGSSSEILGFVTCRTNKNDLLSIGYIELIAVMEIARGKNVGYELMKAAINWFIKQNIDIVEIGTQIDNYAARGLYQKCGMKIAPSVICLHKWL